MRMSAIENGLVVWVFAICAGFGLTAGCLVILSKEDLARPSWNLDNPHCPDRIDAVLEQQVDRILHPVHLQEDQPAHGRMLAVRRLCVEYPTPSMFSRTPFDGDGSC